jgi:transposase-like protein
MIQLTKHLEEKTMSRKRKQYSAEFMTKVVLELLSGDQTVAQVASKYEIVKHGINFSSLYTYYRLNPH